MYQLVILTIRTMLKYCPLYYYKRQYIIPNNCPLIMIYYKNKKVNNFVKTQGKELTNTPILFI